MLFKRPLLAVKDLVALEFLTFFGCFYFWLYFGNKYPILFMHYVLLLFDTLIHYLHNFPWRLQVSIVTISFSVCCQTGHILAVREYGKKYILFFYNHTTNGEQENSFKPFFFLIKKLISYLSCYFLFILSSPVHTLEFFKKFLWLTKYFTLCLYPVQLLFYVWVAFWLLFLQQCL